MMDVAHSLTTHGVAPQVGLCANVAVWRSPPAVADSFWQKELKPTHLDSLCP